MRHGRWLLALGLGCGPGPEAPRVATPPVPAPAPTPEAPPVTWLKGQLHAHTDRSGDSATPASAALQWYAGRGFDFVVVTDHNYVTVADGGAVLAIPGVELTQNLEDCVPPPEPGRPCLLHVNALFVDPQRGGRFAFPPVTDPARRAVYGRALRAARELGGVAQLNHPNFYYSADAPLIGQLVDDGVRLLEVANEAVDSNNAGDADHPSTEALWDAVLTQGKRVYAVATDDAHHYEDAAAVRARGEAAYVGDRGWVMVRAARRVGAIRAAIERGEFYASNGVTLTAWSTDGGVLRVATATPHEFTFVGSGGRVLATMHGTSGQVALADGDSAYVRAVVTAPDGKRAWTQPLWR